MKNWPGPIEIQEGDGNGDHYNGPEPKGPGPREHEDDRDGNGGLQIVNKVDGNYSSNKYNIKNATRDGIVYPPKDPTCFEIKYPDVDIKGRVVSLF